MAIQCLYFRCLQFWSAAPKSSVHVFLSILLSGPQSFPAATSTDNFSISQPDCIKAVWRQWKQPMQSETTCGPWAGIFMTMPVRRKLLDDGHLSSWQEFQASHCACCHLTALCFYFVSFASLHRRVRASEAKFQKKTMELQDEIRMNKIFCFFALVSLWWPFWHIGSHIHFACNTSWYIFLSS